MASRRNPYHYGTPAEGEYFAGRDEELKGLVSRLRNGINAVLISPRRYGKTSLLLRAEEELRKERAAVLHLNILRCRDSAALAGQLATAAYRLPGGWRRASQAIPDFLRRIRLTPTITLAEDDPTFSFGPHLAAADVDSVVADVYAVMSELAGRHPAVLVLDEFQAITALGQHLPALFKSLADRHPNVVLVLAGSRKHIMEDLISDKAAALYGMAEKFELGPLPADVMVTYLRERATSGGKAMDEPTARLIVRLAEPVPNDIQRLAYEAFDAAVGRRIDQKAVEEGLERAVGHEAVTYAERYERLSVGQRRVLLALAEEPTGTPYAAGFVARSGLANSSSVRKAVRALEADEILVRRDRVLVVSDPFFAAWLRHSL